MKSKFTLPTFAALLFAATLAHASSAAPASAPNVPETGAQAPAAISSSACAQPGTAAAIFAPAVQNKTNDFDYCGSCGTDPCRGILRGTICGYDYNLGRYKRCEMKLGDLCPNENRVVCYCYAEDIP